MSVVPSTSYDPVSSKSTSTEKEWRKEVVSGIEEDREFYRRKKIMTKWEVVEKVGRRV